MADFISGLLGLGSDQDPMERAKQAGLLGFGATALQAGAPSLTPTSLGSILGQSVMAGQQSSQQALQQARQQAIQQEMMGTMGGMGGGAGGDVAAQIAKLQKMALLDPKNQAAYLKIAEQLQGKTAAFTGETANAALNLFGTADVSKLNPEQRQQAVEAADAARIRAGNAAAPRMTVNTSDPTAVAREMRGIVNDFDQKTEKPREVISQYQRMVNAVENPSAAGDIALVFSFYKTIDPISAVREGEYDKVLASSSVPDRIKNYIRKVQTGEVLAPSMREDLLNTARQNVNAVVPQLQNLTANYRSFVSSIGGDPDKVIRDPLSGLNLGGSAPPARATSTPPAAPPSGAPRTNPPRRWNPQTGAFE
jgi:hypothetical protein